MSYVDTDKIVVNYDSKKVSDEVLSAIKLFVRNFYSPQCELSIISLNVNINNIEDYLFIINGHKKFYAHVYKRKLIISSLEPKWVNDVDLDIAIEKEKSINSVKDDMSSLGKEK